MSDIGHNGGPSMEKGRSWRSYQWRQAQKALMPKTMPLAIVKMRVRRARALGMDYKAYASIRQATGRDICGLLFSTNALEILAGRAAMPPERRRALETARDVQRLALAHAPLHPDMIAAANPVLEAVARAPDLRMSWAETRESLRAFAAERRLVGDQIVIVGDTALEQEWLGALQAAGYLPAGRYFAASA